jgi:hypothetical protein
MSDPQRPEREAIEQALVELKKWDVWRHNGQPRLAHGIDGTTPTEAEWNAIDNALYALNFHAPALLAALPPTPTPVEPTQLDRIEAMLKRIVRTLPVEIDYLPVIRNRPPAPTGGRE